MVTRCTVALIVLAVLAIPIASAAQCPVEPGWWTYQNPGGSVKLKFHVNPEGTKVDSLEFSLHSVCDVSGVRDYTCAGRTITCEPWGFTWSVSCEPATWTDGFDLAVTFTDAQQASAILDIITWYNGCETCRALETPDVVGAATPTWGGIKALYESR